MKRLIAALMLCTSPLPAIAFDISAMTDDEKAAFGQAVRDYLLENPETLVEAINVLDQRNASAEAENDLQLVAALHDEIFDDGHSWVGGNPDGDLTMVEFIDYRCGVCRRFNDEVHDIVRNDGTIRFILKEFPILGPDSEASARFALSVRQLAGDEVYAKAQHELITLRSAASEEALRGVAERLGVDADQAIAGMQDDAVTAILRENHELAQKMAIQGTPSFVIGDHLLRGVPGAGLTATVEQIRAEHSEG